MPLVAGVDSSTQACKVVVRDAETGALVRDGRAAHPDGTEVDPEAWEVALHQAVDRAGGLDDVAAHLGGGPAARHGLPRRQRPGGAPRAAVERHAVRHGGGRSRGRAGRRPGLGRCRRLGAGRVVHGDQAPLARRARTGVGATDRGRVPPARLADVATCRLAGPGLVVHRSRRRERNRLLVGCQRELPARPADPRLRSGRHPAAGARPDRSSRRACRRRHRPRTGNRRQRRRRARSRRGSRRRDRLDRYVGSGCRRRGQRHHRRLGHRCRVRRCHRAVPSAGLHAQRCSGARCRGPAARRRPRPAVPARPRGAGRRGRAGARPLPRG